MSEELAAKVQVHDLVLLMLVTELCNRSPAAAKAASVGLKSLPPGASPEAEAELRRWAAALAETASRQAGSAQEPTP
jgi:hypothetical protein